MTTMVGSLTESAEVVEHGPHPHGWKYRLDFPVEGPDGSAKTGTLATIWLRKPGEDAPRMITNWVEVHTEQEGTQQ